MNEAREAAARPTRSPAREQCYLPMLRPAETPPGNAPATPEGMRLDHHAFLVELERRGVLFAAGPCRRARRCDK